MKAVILCAGKGSRLSKITEKIPKVLINVSNKSLLEHKLDLLIGLVDEVILVVGYLSDCIINKIGNNYKGLKIKYCEQKELLGTGHALMQTKKFLNNEKFLVMNGDDLYHKNDIKKLLENDFGILAKKVSDYSSFGVCICNKNGYLKEIIEKPSEFISNLANIGCYVLDSSIFNFKLKPSKRGELEIVDYIKLIIEQGKKVKIEKVSGFWLPVNNPSQLKTAEDFFAKNKK